MHNYAGNPASYPANVGLVDDADLNPATAAALDVAGENLADRTAWLKANAVLASGGDITGLLQFSSGAVLLMTGGSSLFLQASSLLEVDSGAVLRVDGGGLVEVLAGGIIQLDGGAIIDVLGAGGIQAKVNKAIEAQAVGAVSSEVAGGFQLNDGSSTNTALGVFVGARTKTVAQSLVLPVFGLASGWGVIANYGLVGPGNSTAQPLLLPLTHDGATLSSVILAFAVPDAHAGGVPATPPSLDIRRVDTQSTGSLPTEVSLGGGAHAFPTGGSGAAWHNSGNIQQFVYTCSANNVINNSRYFYYAVLVDENGANSVPNSDQYFSFALTHTNILDARALY